MWRLLKNSKILILVFFNDTTFTNVVQVLPFEEKNILLSEKKLALEPQARLIN